MVDRTRQAILDSFNSLIEKKSFDSINVQMIADGAGIGRSTFYRYFKDKYDVMNYNFQVILDEYFNTHECETFEDLFCVFLDIGLDKWSSLTKMFESSGANGLHKFIYEASYSSAFLVLARKKGFDKVTDADKLRLSLFCHGIPFAYEEWINGKYNMTSREASKAAMEIVPKELEGKIWE